MGVSIKRVRAVRHFIKKVMLEEAREFGQVEEDILCAETSRRIRKVMRQMGLSRSTFEKVMEMCVQSESRFRMGEDTRAYEQLTISQF